MDLKEEIQNLLEFLKKRGYGRRRIEKELAYSDKYLDQAFNRGGTEELLTRLKLYKKYVLLEAIHGSERQDNILREEDPEYGTKSKEDKLLGVVTSQQQSILILTKQVDRMQQKITSLEGDNARKPSKN